MTASTLADSKLVDGNRRPDKPSSVAIAEHLNRLKERDNVTNWRYLAGVWLIIAASIAGGLWVERLTAAGALSMWALLPTWIVTTAVIGASQHQLGGAIHEGVHGLLFRDKRLNELASDWLAAFPIYTSTYQYRVQHLAHHQFVNDPQRDPDIAQLKDSDHWLDFPVTHVELVRALLRQLWPPNLMRYTLMRAKYGSIGHKDNPYVDRSAALDPIPIRIGVFFAVAVPFIVTGLQAAFGGSVGLWFLLAAYAVTLVYFLRLPEAEFPQTRLKAIVSHKATTISRMTFLFAVYLSLTLYDVAHGGTFALEHYGVYWAIPLFTSFPLFMMLRQWVQHGNADRGRYTNTRVFLVGPLARYAVFPWGMDYHLPHHAFASVPHYRLKDLHELMLSDPKYAAQNVVVEHITGEQNPETGRPTILSLLAKKAEISSENHVDEDVLEYVDVRDGAYITAESEKSRNEP